MSGSFFHETFRVHTLRRKHWVVVGQKEGRERQGERFIENGTKRRIALILLVLHLEDFILLRNSLRWMEYENSRNETSYIVITRYFSSFNFFFPIYIYIYICIFFFFLYRIVNNDKTRKIRSRIGSKNFNNKLFSRLFVTWIKVYRENPWINHRIVRWIDNKYEIHMMY